MSRLSAVAVDRLAELARGGGGGVEAVVRNARSADGTGLMVSSSRAILYASSGDEYAEAAATAARTLRDTINRFR